MSSPILRSSWRLVMALGLAVVFAPVTALGDANNTGTVDCTDKNTRDACIECCATPTCIGKISCCPLVGSCTVVNGLSTSGGLPGLKLNVTAGGLKLQFLRNGTASGTNIKLKAVFLPHVFPHALAFKAQLTGTDARLGGLLYPIAFIAMGDGALDTLHALGYDVAVDEGTLPTCQATLPAQVCTDLANMLAKSIAGALGMGIRGELGAFDAGTQALALQAATTTTTTTATTTTTSTTMTGPCRFSSDPNSAGVCGGTCPVGQTCLLNAPNGSTCQCVKDGAACGSSNCMGECPVQFEHCERSPVGGACGCCTFSGDPCAAETVCCNGEPCGVDGTCPFTTPSTSATSTSTTSTSSTTSTTVPCSTQGGACITYTDCCNASPAYYCNTAFSCPGFCDVLQ